MEIEPDTLSCVPFALSMVYRLSYEIVCHMIMDAGVPYNAVPVEIIEKLLNRDFKVIEKKTYQRKLNLNKWNKRGIWVAVLDRANGRGIQAHCAIIHNGRMMDNHSVHGANYNYDDSAAVCHAWQLKEAV
jgi:hypothetical protein